MYIAKENMAAALDFIRGPLWADMKKAAFSRRPPSPEPGQQPHEAAARGFQRDAWEKAFAELEKLPFEQAEPTASPFDRPAVTDQKD